MPKEEQEAWDKTIAGANENWIRSITNIQQAFERAWRQAFDDIWADVARRYGRPE